MRLSPLLSFLLVAATSCLGSAAAHPTGPLVGEGRRILFIGNSLTYYNDLPELIRVLADSAGETLLVRTVGQPDYSLMDHWAHSEARREIDRGGWEFVVLQQGPSSLEESRANLREWTRVFAEAIGGKAGRPALYSVWPSRSRHGDFPRAIESYTLAAEDVNGVLLPVASAWLAAWRRDATLPLHHPDGLHPSMLGSYLAALVITAQLTGVAVEHLPSRIRLSTGAIVDVGSATGEVLRASAAEALAAATPR